MTWKAAKSVDRDGQIDLGRASIRTTTIGRPMATPRSRAARSERPRWWWARTIR